MTGAIRLSIGKFRRATEGEKLQAAAGQETGERGREVTLTRCSSEEM